MAKKYKPTSSSKHVAKEPVPVYGTFSRITFTPKIMAGQACVRGMRIPVSLVINLVAHGMTTEEIIREYPDLEAEDIAEAVRFVPYTHLGAFASWRLRTKS